jgi:O-antigen ligase
MYWFIILFPLMIYPWGIDPYYTFPKTSYLLLFVLVYWLYVFVKRKNINIQTRTFFPEKLILILTVLIGISTFFSVDKETSIYGILDRKEGIITLYCYFSIFLFATWFLEREKLKILFKGMAISSIPVSFYGILQHYFMDFLPRNSLKYDNRAFSFFDNANFFGTYLVLIILLTISLYLSVSSKRIGVLYLFITCLSFVALIFSSTRSGYLGVLGGIIFLSIFVILKRKYLWKKWMTLLASFSLLLVVINILENGAYWNRFNSVISDSYNVISNQTTGHEGSFRIFIWKASLPLVNEYFWFGSGPDTFGLVFPNDKELSGFTDVAKIDKAHNEYLQMGITMGVPALLTYLLLVSIILGLAFKAVKRAKEKEKIILYGMISAILGYLIQAFFNISVVPVAPLFWALLGFTLAKSRSILVEQSSRNESLKTNNQVKKIAI